MDITLVIAKAEEYLRQGALKRAQTLLDGLVDSVREGERGSLYDLLGRVHVARSREYFKKSEEEGFEVLDDQVAAAPPKEARRSSSKQDGVNVLEEMRVRILIETLEDFNWVQSAAAAHLGVSKYQVHRLLAKYEMLEQVRVRREARSRD